MRKHLPVAAIFVLLTAAQAQDKKNLFLLDVETGVVSKGAYNEIRVPGNGGTGFDIFKSGFSPAPKFFYRLRAGVTLNERHTILALFAPLALQVNSNGNLAQPIAFNGSNFEAGRPLQVYYKFNAYRLSYRYNFIRTAKVKMGAGISFLWRDAAIELKNNAVSSRYNGPGPVPLLNLHFNWLPRQHFGFLLEADALAGRPEGRAVDAFAGVNFPLNPRLAIRAGYRVFEGGVNIDKVYNFAWFNYASAGLTLAL